MSIQDEQATETEQRNGYQEEGETVFELFSVWEVWEEFLGKISKYYRFEPRIGGSFSGFDVFTLATGAPIEGLTVPKDFTYWKKLNPNDRSRYAKYGQEVKSVLEAMGNANSSKTYQAKLGSIFNGLLGTINNNKSELAAQAYIRSTEVHTLRTISGMPEAHKVVPLLSWFPTDIQQLDPIKMLSIFPETEAKVLMLVLGKAMVGYNGCKLREGTLEHKARAYAMMVDTRGGLGKSTLMTWVREAMVKLGYNVTTVNMNMSKFGWGSIAQSDLALIDDLENEKLGELISSFQIKSLVTNGFMAVEEKGLPAQEVQSYTTVLGASNTSDPRHFFKMDGGSMSRLNQLSTYSENELSQMFGHFQLGGIYEQWNALSDRLSCSIEMLTSYLLARSAEYFLSEIGVRVIDSEIVKVDDTLQDTMEALRDNLRISPKLTYTDDFLQGLGNFEAYRCGTDLKVSKDQARQILNNVRLTPELLIQYIGAFNTTPEEYRDLIYPPTLSRRSLEYAIAKLTELANQQRSKSYSAAFANIINEFTSDQGFPYPSTISFYEPRWQRAIDGCFQVFLTIREEYLKNA